MTKQARDAAKQIMSAVKKDPTSAAFVVVVPGGWRVIPEEVWIEPLGWWVRLSDMMISGNGTGPLYPGWIMRGRLRGLFAWWVKQDGVHTPPACAHLRQSRVSWTQDGWTSHCRVCCQTVHHGDDATGMDCN